MTVSIERTVLVTVKNDPELVLAFLEWGLANRVYSIKSGGGHTYLSSTFDAEDGPKIEKFFRDWKNAKRREKAAALR